MATFVGRYEHSLDAKGRVVLPSKFRAAFEQGGTLTRYFEGCLALWTPGEFQRQMAGVEAEAATGRRGRNRARIMTDGSYDVDVDRQGRMPIPARLRSFAALESDVIVLGALNHIELWSPASWERQVAPAERFLLEGEAEEDG